MKKIYLLLIPIAFLIPSFVKADFSHTISPSGSEILSPVTIGLWMDNFELNSGCYPNYDSFGIDLIASTEETYTSTNFAHSSEAGFPYNYFQFNLPAGTEITGIYVACFGEGVYGEAGNWITGDEVNPIFTIISPPIGGIGGWINNASSTVKSAFGFSPYDITTWAGHSLFGFIVASGIAILPALAGWLMVIVIIMGIIYFAYRAFRFFKH